jgi:glycosyltransferase involved in cell wall biosynthesis
MNSKKIGYVDRYVSNSTKLFEGIIKNENFKFLFIGPKITDENWISNQKLKNAEEVWSYGHYVRSIFKKSKKLKLDLIHLIFELKTYGPLLSILKFPLLLILLRLTKTKICTTLVTILIYRKDNQWEVVPYVPFKIPKFLITFFVKSFIKIISNLSHRIIVQTDEGKKGLVEFFGINSEKIDVIRLGIEKKLKQIPEQNEISKIVGERKIIYYFGVISPRKGQEMAIKAFKKIEKEIPDHILVISGKAPKGFEKFEEKIHLLVKDLELTNRVIFTGFVSDDQMEWLFEKAVTSLFIYQPMSGSAYALTFAIKNNTPAIISDLPIFHEVLGNDGGVYVKYNDEEQIGNEILKFIKNKPNQLKIKKELVKILENNPWEDIASQHIKSYKKII